MGIPQGYALINGLAGAGKSTAMEAVRVAYEKRGVTVLGQALAGKAAAELEKSADIASRTIHSMCQRIESGKQKIDKNTVLIVDEAGMIGTRLSARLHKLADEYGAKVIRLGDIKQVQPVDAGGTQRALWDKIGGAELREISRQYEGWARDAVANFERGNAMEALAAFRERGYVHMDDDRNKITRQLVEDWYKYVSRDHTETFFDDRFGAGKEIEVKIHAWDYKRNIMIASTNDEVSTINELARLRLKTAAQLDRVGVFAPVRRDNKSEAEHKEFSVGERIRFTNNSNTLGVKNGHLGIVKEIEETPNGDVRMVIETDQKDDYGHPKKVELYTSEYNYLDYGYGMTVTKWQGATEENSWVLAGHRGMEDLHNAYVAASRQKGHCHIYADSGAIKEQMAEQEPTEKMIAYAEKIAAERNASIPAGTLENFQLCREWLNDNSPKQIDKASEKEDELAFLARMMSRERLKELSTDYVRDEMHEAELLLYKKEREYLQAEAKRIAENDPKSEQKLYSDLLFRFSALTDTVKYDLASGHVEKDLRREFTKEERKLIQRETDRQHGKAIAAGHHVDRNVVEQQVTEKWLARDIDSIRAENAEHKAKASSREKQ